MPDTFCVVTAVAEPRPDGERITKAVIEFNGKVPDVEGITVKDRTIVKREVCGNTVTLTLCENDKAAFVFPEPPHPAGGPKGHKPGDGEKPKNRPAMPPRVLLPVEVTVSIPGIDGEIVSTKVSEPVIENFSQGTYKDLLYNLFVPEKLEEGNKYPLVMFIPDASVNGDDARMALVQGIGATVWADPEWQKDNPCYVLAVQIPKKIHLTNDEYTCAPEISDVKELLDKIIAENSVDTSRVYATGQSQGCMASCYLNIKYPELFAASVLVSGHWNIEKMLKLTDAKFLFGWSTGAGKENVCFNALAEGYKKEGVTVAKEHFNFREGWDVNNAKAEKLINTGAQMIYVMFDGETAFPDGGPEYHMTGHHNRGWELTYQLKPVRDWLFSHHK